MYPVLCNCVEWYLVFGGAGLLVEVGERGGAGGFLLDGHVSCLDREYFGIVDASSEPRHQETAYN